MASLSIPHHLKDCRKQRHGCGFRYVDGKTIYRNGKPQPCIGIVLYFLMQEAGGYRDDLLRRGLRRKVFQARLPHTAEPVIVIRFRNAVAGTPVDNTHVRGAVLALPDLLRPLFQTVLYSHCCCC